MPRHQRTDELDTDLRRHTERLYDLERGGPEPGEPTPLREAVFSFFGDIGLAVSPRWSHPDGALLVGVLVQLDTPGSTATTVVVRRNASTIATVVVPAGQARAEFLGQGTGVSPQDWLQAAITGAGNGARSLTVQVRFR